MMKKKLFSVIALIFPVMVSFAQETGKNEKTSIDPLDISDQLAQIEKYGVPTITSVNELKAKADALYESKSWAEATVAYELFAHHANWLANLLSQCVEPYYSASYDDRKSMSYNLLKSFVPFESKSNEYKKERNRAYVKIGLCHKEMGDIKNAVVYLHKGLDLLSVEDIAYWTLAKNAMSEILGYMPGP